MFSGAGSAAAGTCPECPGGCVPPGAQPMPPEPDDIVPSENLPVSEHDISRGQILLGPVVFEKVPGQVSLITHNFQILEVQYSPVRYIQMGAAMIMPPLGMGGVGTLRFNWNIGKSFGIGFGCFGGGMSSEASLVTDSNWGFAGLHAGVSIIPAKKIILNIGIFVAYVSENWPDDGSGESSSNVGIIPIPHIGILVPFSPRWSFVGEMFFPVTQVGRKEEEPPDDEWYDGDGWLHSSDVLDLNFNLDLEHENPFMLYYGFRFTEDRLFGDMGFFFPMQPELIKMLMYCPPGLPYVSFGVRF